MFQPRQNLALRLEALHLRRRLALQELDGDSLLEVPVGARGFIDFTHAAAAEQPRDAPGAETQSHGAVRNQFLCRLGRDRQKTARRARRAQQTFNFGEHGGVFDSPGAQIRDPLRFGQVEHIVQQRIDAGALRGSQRGRDLILHILMSLACGQFT